MGMNWWKGRCRGGKVKMRKGKMNRGEKGTKRWWKKWIKRGKKGKDGEGNVAQYFHNVFLIISPFVFISPLTLFSSLSLFFLFSILVHFILFFMNVVIRIRRVIFGSFYFHGSYFSFLLSVLEGFHRNQNVWWWCRDMYVCITGNNQKSWGLKVGKSFSWVRNDRMRVQSERGKN